MATRTVYVADADLELYERAAALAGGLSAAVTGALRRYVAVEEARMERFDEVTVRVGSGWTAQEKRFVGRRLVRVRLPERAGRVTTYDVYRTHHGRLAVHWGETVDWSHWTSAGDEAWDDPASWTGEWCRPGPRALDVYENLEQLRSHVPDEVARAATEALDAKAVEVLDI